MEKTKTWNFLEKKFFYSSATKDSDRCSLCGNTEREMVVIGSEPPKEVKLANVVLDDFEFSYAICAKHLELFIEIVAMAAVLTESTDS